MPGASAGSTNHSRANARPNTWGGSASSTPNMRAARPLLPICDRWAASAKLTFTVGVRFGHQRPYYEEGTRTPILTDVFPTQTVPEKTLLTRSNIAPRVGVAYDLFGSGKTAVKAFYGRYYAIYGNNFTSLNPGGANYRIYTFLDPNRNGVYDGPIAALAIWCAQDVSRLRSPKCIGV